MSSDSAVRPPLVTFVGSAAIAGSVLSLFTAFSTISQLHTLTFRRSLEERLGERLTNTGFGVDELVVMVRVVTIIGALAAIPVIVWSYELMRRNPKSLRWLSGFAAVMAVAGILADEVWSLMVGVVVSMAWWAPSRAWLSGETNPSRDASGSTARMDAWTAGESQATDSPIGRSGAAVSVAAQPRVTTDGQVGVERPSQVRTVALLTWGFGGLAIVAVIFEAVLFVRAAEATLAQAAQDADSNAILSNVGVPPLDVYLAVGLVFFAGLIMWALAAMAVAWVMLRGHEWARIVLLISAGLATGVAAFAVLGSRVEAIPILIACAVSVQLLMRGDVRRWFSQGGFTGYAAGPPTGSPGAPPEGGSAPPR